jgi:DNA-directed RNA polymerase II subunit RPB1
MLVCNGHIGHMELPLPVYHISYISDLVKILRSLCPQCFRLVSSPTDPAYLHIVERWRLKERYQMLCSYLKNKKVCGHADCGFLLPKYKQHGFTIKREWPASAKRQFNPEPESSKKDPVKFVPAGEQYMAPFTPAVAHSILEMVDDEVFVALGLTPTITHPCSFILTVLVVPPPVIRPSIMFSESCRTRGQDDLTHKLQEILKQCQKVRTVLEEEGDVNPAFELLQMLVATYMNNESTGAKLPTKKRSGQPEKCVVKRLKGKRGRFRGNLMGKRVDFTARTVISPDSVMDVDEIGIPLPVALRLTFVEVVTNYNIEQLRLRVCKGPGVIDGARSIIKDTGQLIALEMCKNRANIRLQLGWSVERYMQNGDTVLFNRQPSLRKKSMMAHTVKIMPGNTFRLNLCCTGPYNGDFDGDEMNLHMLQSVDAVVEAKLLMGVGSSLLNAQSNKPCMGIVQDSLVGAYLLTQPDTFLTKAEISQLIMNLRYPKTLELPPPAILKPVQLWTGKQVMSLIIPDISLVKKEVVIRHGVLLQGTLCKQTLGATSGGIIDVTCKMHDNQTALRFMSDCQRIVNAWMENYGFSVGVSDCLVDPVTQSKITKAVEACLGHIETVNSTGKSLSIPFQYREGHVSRILSKMLNVTGGLVQEQMHRDNSLMAMVTSGSKGNPINISQISGCVGQQSIEGHRIFDEDSPEDRTIACFPKNADNAPSRGFVQHSYIQGLSPEEVFFHMMGGREGIVDTSVKTADTGYLQRRIVKALESISVQYDETVRDSYGNIVEFRYGGDSCDAAYLDKISLSFLTFSRERLQRDFGGDSEELRAMLELNRECIRTKINLLATQLTTDAHIPVNIASILGQLHLDLAGPPVTAMAVQSGVAALIARFRSLPKQTLFLRASLAYHLRSAVLVQQLHLSVSQLADVLNLVERQYHRAQVDAGEMVGVLAAESVGEPCTQLTLNTFHHAGVAEKNVTLGVPRIKELIDARRNNQTPSTDLFLREPFCRNKRYVDKLKETLTETYLKDVVQSFEIVLDPDTHCTIVEHEVDQFLVRTWRQFGGRSSSSASRYLIRIVLNRELLKSKELNVSDVTRMIRQKLPGTDMYHLLASEPNMRDWIIRVRMCGLEEMRDFMLAELQTGRHKKKKPLDEYKEQIVLEFEKNMAHAFLKYLSRIVYICGVQGVEHATAQQQTSTQWDPDTLQQSNVMEHCLQVSGLNLREFWKIDVVDWRRSFSNNVFEILDLLGIEAAALVLFHEIKTVLSFDGCYVNSRHIMMIVNVMTRTGGIMPLNRHGLNRLDVGPLVKCTFEETVDIIFEAGLFSETNPINSISDSIMTGQLIPGGTGKVELQMTAEYELSTQQKVQPTDTQVIVIRTYYSQFAHDKPRALDFHQLKRKLKEEEDDLKQPRKHARLEDLQVLEHTSGFFSDLISPTSPTYISPTSPILGSATSPTYSPTYEPLSPTYSPTATLSYEPLSPTYSPKKTLATMQIHSSVALEVEEKTVLNYSDGASARGNPTMSVTTIQQLESQPVYSYRPSTPLLSLYTDSQYTPNSPRLQAQSNVHINDHRTIHETLQHMVPSILALNEVERNHCVLYKADTGELDVEAFEAALDQLMKNL